MGPAKSPRYEEDFVVHGNLKAKQITLLYQLSRYIKVQKQRTIKNWEQQNHLVIRGFCYILPLY